MKKSSLPWLFALWAITGVAGHVSAQPKNIERQRYIKFNIDPDFEAKLKQRLGMEAQLGPFKDLIKKIMADPSKMPANPEDLKGLNLDSDKFKDAIREWAARDPELGKLLENLAKKKMDGEQPKDVEKFQADLQKFLKQNPLTNPATTPEAAPDVPPPVAINPNDPRRETLAETAARLMKKTEDTKLGDWLRDSPAWNRAFQDLRANIAHPDPSRWNLEDWQNKLRLPDGRFGRLGEGAMDRFRQLPRPSLSRLNLPTPKLDNIRMPNVGGPRLPDLSAPSVPGLAGALTWIVVVLLLMLAAYLLLRRSRSAGTTADARPDLGPWPVRPEAVATRAELIQAFDYLALWTLGLSVQSWNHHAVAQRWRNQAPPCAESAQTLEALYERARYTEGADTLAPSEREQARRCLVQLAEAL